MSFIVQVQHGNHKDIFIFLKNSNSITWACHLARSAFSWVFHYFLLPVICLWNVFPVIFWCKDADSCEYEELSKCPSIRLNLVLFWEIVGGMRKHQEGTDLQLILINSILGQCQICPKSLRENYLICTYPVIFFTLLMPREPKQNDILALIGKAHTFLYEK